MFLSGKIHYEAMQVMVEKNHEEMKMMYNNMKRELLTQTEAIEKMNNSITGNGKPGIKTDLDRLKQDRKLRDRHTKFMWGMIAAIFIALVVEIIKQF